MLTPELLTYIKNQVAAGQNKENIKNILLANGWLEADVNAAFGELGGVAAQADARPGATPTATPVSFTKPEQLIASKQPELNQPLQEKPISPAVSERSGLNANLGKPAEPTVGPKEVSFPAEPQTAPSMQAIAPDIEKPAVVFVGQSEVMEPEFKKESLPAFAPEISRVEAEPQEVKTMAELNSTQRKFSLNIKKEDLLKVGGGALAGLVLGALIFGVGGAVLRNRVALPTPASLSPTPEVQSPAASPELELFGYSSAEQGFKISYPVAWITNPDPVEVSSTTKNVFTADSGAGATLVVALNESTSTSLTLAGEVERLSAIYESLPGFSIANQEQVALNSSEAAYLLDVRGSLEEGVSVRSYQLVVLKPDSQEYFVVALTAEESLWAEQEAGFRQILLSFEFLQE